MLDDFITRDALHRLAGDAAFQRGQTYAKAGAVSRLRQRGERLDARVEGSESYQVELRADAGELGYHCTCPRAADGYFCKHCVAVGLTWLAQRASGTPPEDPWADIRIYLETQSPETLIALLLDVAERDDRLYRSLQLKAHRLSGAGDRIKSLRQAIDQITRTSGFGACAEDLDDFIDSLEDLLTPEDAGMLVDLTEYAIQRAESALGELDDEDGEFGHAVERLGRLHQDACRLLRPDPVGLAERLFRLATRPEIDLCSFDPLTYRELLGEAGLARYRELAEAKWRALGQSDPKKGYDPERFRITSLMEQLAQADGDLEQLIAIRSRDLTSASRYLDIAELWIRAGRPELALEWAERGLAAFPARTDNRLRDFLASAYLERGRQEEALQLTWVQFEEQPALGAYQKLHDLAVRLAVWPAQRERALGWLATSIQRAATEASRWRPQPVPANQSLRVEIALWEDDPEAAWLAVHQGSCETKLLVRLADRLVQNRIDDAIALYQRAVHSLAGQTSNHAYDEATRLISRIGDLLTAEGRKPEFRDYLGELYSRHKSKRNFIKLLDALTRPGQSR